MVGTLNGHLEHIIIEITNNNINIKGTRIQHEINSTKFLLYGLTASTNNAFLMSALYIGQVRCAFGIIKNRREFN